MGRAAALPVARFWRAHPTAVAKPTPNRAAAHRHVALDNTAPAIRSRTSSE